MAAGHVRKRGNKWAAVVFLGLDGRGKRKYKWYSGFDTKKAAQAELNRILHEMNEGTYVVPVKSTMESYMLRWLEHVRDRVRPGTYRQYEWLTMQHIIPHIGRIAPDKLQAEQVQRLYDGLLHGDKPLSARSVLHLHRVLHQAMGRAVKWGIVARNVCEAVEPPPPKKVAIEFWEEAELTEFLRAATSSQHYIAFLLLASTGMRVGEVLGLRWDRVDLDKGVISVEVSYSYTGSGYELEAPKTEAGRRSVDISDGVVAALRAHKSKQAKLRLKLGEKWEDNNLVVATGTGRFVLGHNLRKSFNVVVERAGLKRIPMYNLRHTHATIMLRRGVHPKIVQERLGHSDISVTLNTYSQVIPGLQAAAANSLDDLFSSIQTPISKA